jgi:hypothetical protein
MKNLIETNALAYFSPASVMQKEALQARPTFVSLTTHERLDRNKHSSLF